MGAPTGSLVTAPKPNTGGVMYGAPLGTALPTDATTALNVAFVKLGYLTSDGSTNEEEIESSEAVAFGGDTVLTMTTSRKETFTQAFLQTLDVDVLKEYYGQDNVVVEDGNPMVRHNAKSNGKRSFVQEYLHSNGTIQRTVIPEGELFRSGGVQSQNGTPRSFESSITAYPSSQVDGDTARDYYAVPSQP
ncbi:phage tail protein [Actinomycetaceae bacterium MB13-C1-2]|nr:phage tail protein [Actinomycetaceae bacterium MB13-C1-2]